MNKTFGFVAALWATTALTACSAAAGSAGPPADGGPLKIGGEAGEVCLSLDEQAETDLTYAIDLLDNGSDKPIEITGLQAVNAQNVSVGEAVVVPLPDRGTIIGASNTWPAEAVREEGSVAEAWKHRQPIAGYTLPPASEGGSHNLVVRLVPDGKARSASIDALQVEYLAGEKAYQAATTTKIVLAPSCL